MSRFAERYLERVGAGKFVPERAKEGLLTDRLALPALAELMTDAYGGLEYEDTVRELEIAAVCGALVATIKSKPDSHLRERPDGKGFEVVERLNYLWVVHRDDARRYFRKLRLEPEPDSPLWCWLHNATPGTPAEEADRTLKADFQQRCIEHWKVSLTPVTGKNGIGALFEGEFPRARKTLEDWAREVAPPEVSARIGRPKNPPK